MGAGVSSSLAPTMAAIALAESGGCQYALACTVDLRPVKECRFRDTTGQSSPECSYGLWQINMVRASPPHLELFDPRKNAEAMAAKLLNQGLGAWSVYNSGAYKQYLPPGGGGIIGGEPPGGGGAPYTPPVGTVKWHAPGSWKVLTRALGHDLAGALYRSKRIRLRTYRALR